MTSNDFWNFLRSTRSDRPNNDLTPLLVCDGVGRIMAMEPLQDPMEIHTLITYLVVLRQAVEAVFVEGPGSPWLPLDLMASPQWLHGPPSGQSGSLVRCWHLD